MKKIFLLLCLLSSFIVKGQWQSCDLNMIEAYCLASKDSMVCVGSSGMVFTSLNNGSTWMMSGSGLPQNLNILNITISGSTIFAGTLRGIWLSSDNGNSWIQANSGLTDTIVFSLTISGTDVLAGTHYGGVFRYTDNNGTWNITNIGLAQHKIYSLASAGNIIFAGSDSGKVFVSTNNGAQWTISNFGLPSSRVSSLQMIGTSVFAGILNSGVYISTDNGNNWNNVSSGLVSNSVLSLASFGTNILAGTDSGIYYSSDYGNQWNDLNMGMTGIATSIVRSITISNSNIFIALSTPIPANPVWYLPISEMITNITEMGTAAMHFLTLYPNPTAGKFKLKSELKIDLIEVYNVLGKKVFQTSNFNHQLDDEIDLSSMPKGIYFVRVYNGRKGYDKKIVIQ